MADQQPQTQSLRAPLPPPRVRVATWAVEVLAGPDAGLRVETSEDLLRVGSGEDNDLVLSDPTVSRRHVELERDARGLRVRDLGSRNGTLLEGRGVLHAPLQPGERLQLGATRLLVRGETGARELELSADARFGQLVGASERMRHAFALLRHAAAHEDLSLLIEGETGTGKELAARAVHQHSLRQRGPFHVLDCALLPPAAERELFGAPAGPGPDAPPAFVGALEAARGGTLVLDEVGEVPLSLQARLVRALEAREVPGRGARVDLRLVATTQKNLEEEVRRGRFREDLYHRLAGLRVRLPPLRARREDLPLLARALGEERGGPGALPPALLALLEGYDWPGNVRELRNVLEGSGALEAAGEAPEAARALLARGPGAQDATLAGARTPGLCKLSYHEAKDRVLAQFERHYFAEVMREVGFDMPRAEERTGLSMQSLYRLLKKNGLRIKELKNAEDLDK
ncbi:FHA domain-containing protein [Aggregicoccus sp. 17bor-14]|uniref:sigma 54-interacting transcriptional regulator n=1 Tax=Myxococcaceae TaxID=31 RepID=UPI00129CA734|nr:MULTISPECIES: sigma 54-interacting transcriptional regulator [Myxococcaceae]MBF5042528.1 sigma 54-interacting transcriptional regulator [Simulacricoccus sp. 17bor-14]MRI88298.1 FHA domain-containing protein [Aggregicoccus sp. 17bor-14]